MLLVRLVIHLLILRMSGATTAVLQAFSIPHFLKFSGDLCSISEQRIPVGFSMRERAFWLFLVHTFKRGARYRHRLCMAWHTPVALISSRQHYTSNARFDLPVRSGANLDAHIAIDHSCAVF